MSEPGRRSTTTQIVVVLICVVIAGGVLVARSVHREHVPKDRGPSRVSAIYAVLLDGDTGKVLWGSLAATRHPIASTAKIMNAELVLESGVDLGRTVTIKKAYREHVLRLGASTAGFRVGDRPTIQQLLYAMLLPSGSDAAYALADAVGKGRSLAAREANFVARMNRRARSLGLNDMTFGSPDGTGPGDRTSATATDMALLARQVLKNPTFASIVATLSVRAVVPTRSRRSHTFTWRNSNRLLGSYAGVVGVKTGTSSPAGPCLVFAARRSGHYVVGVVLDSATAQARFRDAARMLDWAWKHF